MEGNPGPDLNIACTFPTTGYGGSTLALLSHMQENFDGHFLWVESDICDVHGSTQITTVTTTAGSVATGDGHEQQPDVGSSRRLVVCQSELRESSAKGITVSLKVADSKFEWIGISYIYIEFFLFQNNIKYLANEVMK